MKAIDSHHAQDDVLVVGRIASPFGVRGWLRITAFTAVAESLLEYSPWYLKVQGQWQAVEPLAGRHHGKARRG